MNKKPSEEEIVFGALDKLKKIARQVRMKMDSLKSL